MTWPALASALTSHPPFPFGILNLWCLMLSTRHSRLRERASFVLQNLSGGSWTCLLYFSQYFYKISLFTPESERLKQCFGRDRIAQITLWDRCFHLYSGPSSRKLKWRFSGFLSGAHKRLYKYPSCSSPRSPGTCGYDASMFLQERLFVPAPPVSFSLSFPATAPLGGSCHIVSPSSRCSPSAVIFLPLRQYY